MSFKTHVELFNALIKGNKIVCGTSSIRLINGILMNENGIEATPFDFTPSLWSVYKKPEKKRVYQWRYLHKPGLSFVVGNLLLTEEEASKEYSSECVYEKHYGPFEVTNG